MAKSLCGLILVSAVLVIGCSPKSWPFSSGRMPIAAKKAAPRPTPAPVPTNAPASSSAVAEAERAQAKTDATDAGAKTAESSAVVPSATSPSGVLYQDQFTDLTGSIHWNRNGTKSTEKAPNERTIYFFSAPPEDGNLTMKIVEDHEATGADDKPGVLAFSWDELPAKLPWSGFVYLGRKVERMTLPPLKMAKTAEDLQKFKLSFRYKAVAKDREKPIALMIGCRLEPQLADSYNKRVDCGTLTATDTWQTFSMVLGEGKNVEAFLKSLADEKPGAFKVIWAQAGALKDYAAGDTLLVDDLTVETTEPK